MDVAYALGAGTGGALASVFVKLAVTAPAMLCAAVPASCEGTEDADAGWFSQAGAIVRAACIGLMVLSNAAMWALLTAAYGRTANSVRVNVASTAGNVAATALLGSLLFGDVLSLRWYAGASFLVAGVVVLTTGQPSNHAKATADQTKGPTPPARRTRGRSKPKQA